MTRVPDPVFHKMHGAGNDFVLLDLRGPEGTPGKDIDAATARFLSDRRLGVGCDQILLVISPTRPDSLAGYAVRNADGQPAGQCGNGARCIAHYLAMSGETGNEPFTLDSPAGPVRVVQCDDGEFEIGMGEPAFGPGEVPVRLPLQDGGYAIDSPWGELRFRGASMGNPHALLVVDDAAAAPVETVGPWLGRHEVFPEGCNVGFAQIRSRSDIVLRVFERGAGETPACGSGACAAVAMLRREGLVDDRVDVFLPGGHLVIQWPASGTVRMKGPAVHVFRGTLSHE